MYSFCTELHSRSRRDKRRAVDKRGTEDAAKSRQFDINYDYYGAIDIDDDPLTTAASDQLGSFDGHHKCDNGVSICLLLTTLAGIGVLYFILFTRITMAGRRRKRRRRRGADVPDDAWHQVSEGLRLFDSDVVVDFIFSGM